MTPRGASLYHVRSRVKGEGDSVERRTLADTILTAGGRRYSATQD